MRAILPVTVCIALAGCGAAREQQLATNNDLALRALLGKTKYFDGKPTQICRSTAPTVDCIYVSQGSATFIDLQNDEEGRAIYTVRLADGKSGYMFSGHAASLNDEDSHRRAVSR